jgi:hypothetical protein
MKQKFRRVEVKFLRGGQKEERVRERDEATGSVIPQAEEFGEAVGGTSLREEQVVERAREE